MVESLSHASFYPVLVKTSRWDELIRVWWSEVDITVTSQNTFMAKTQEFRHLLWQFFTQMSNMTKWWSGDIVYKRSKVIFTFFLTIIQGHNSKTEAPVLGSSLPEPSSSHPDLHPFTTMGIWCWILDPIISSAVNQLTHNIHCMHMCSLDASVHSVSTTSKLLFKYFSLKLLPILCGLSSSRLPCRSGAVWLGHDSVVLLDPLSSHILYIVKFTSIRHSISVACKLWFCCSVLCYSLPVCPGRVIPPLWLYLRFLPSFFFSSAQRVYFSIWDIFPHSDQESKRTLFTVQIAKPAKAMWLWFSGYTSKTDLIWLYLSYVTFTFPEAIFQHDILNCSFPSARLRK